MEFPDIWSMLTGCASLLSLFISVGKKFAAWRKYTIPVAAGLGGFAVGRISPTLSLSINHLLSDPKAAGFILIFFIIITVITIVAYALMRHGETMLAYFVFVFSITSVPAVIMPLYTNMYSSIPPGDYLKLAQLKISANEYEDAIKYLELAKDNTKDNDLRKAIKEKINFITRKRTEELSGKSNGMSQ